MNFNTVNVVMLALGGLLIYAAIKDQSVKEVISNAFTTQGGASGSQSTNDTTAGDPSSGTQSPGHASLPHRTTANTAVVTSN